VQRSQDMEEVRTLVRKRANDMAKLEEALDNQLP
jgi:hypothetical protein